jgi:hypothetical protein
VQARAGNGAATALGWWLMADEFYTRGYVIPPERLAEVQAAMAPREGHEIDPNADEADDPHWASMTLPGGRVLFSVYAGASTGEPGREAVKAMAGRVVDLMHEWAAQASDAETGHLRGHRYTHVAPGQDDSWLVVNRWGGAPLGGFRGTEVQYGSITGFHMEHDFGEVVAYGPMVDPINALLLCAPPDAEEEFLALMRELQEVSDYIEMRGPPSDDDGPRSAVPPAILPHNRRRP